ncbi:MULTISPECIES: hypothetical protein [unclassified Methylobacterium]|uniref:hypothetical protein n=2 Tax=Methylobacterium TaxID=407 RepID=UPI0036F8F710
MEIAAARYVADVAVCDVAAHRAAVEASEKLGDDILLELAALDEIDTNRLLDPDGTWRLPAGAGPLCRECGGEAPHRSRPTCDACAGVGRSPLMLGEAL